MLDVILTTSKEFISIFLGHCGVICYTYSNKLDKKKKKTNKQKTTQQQQLNIFKSFLPLRNYGIDFRK